MAATDKNRMKKMMTMAAAATLATAVVVGGGSFAYLKGQADKVNEFTTNKVELTISETDNTYNIIPGTDQEKDPLVNVDYTLDSFVFLKVTDTTKLDNKDYDLVTYDIIGDWIELEELETNSNERIFYQKIKHEGNAGEIEHKDLQVLVNNEVTYLSAIVNDDMKNGDNLKTDVKLAFNAIAIQAVPFIDEDADIDNLSAEVLKQAAIDAYDEAAGEPIHVSTYTELKTAAEGIRSGQKGTIILDDDIVVDPKEYRTVSTSIAGDVTLKLNGKNISFDDEVSYSSYLFYVNGGHLTIRGDGTITAKPGNITSTFYVQGGTLTIKSGNFYSYERNINVTDHNGANAEIYGGKFYITNDTYYSTNNRMLNTEGKGQLVIKGGTFADFDPSNKVRNYANKNFVANGYEVESYLDNDDSTIYETYYKVVKSN